ncbi:glycosyltransferase [Prosthecobacter sp.]|uniref:glycosyltransferase n=1 Tax=Prosthecobacter sp. TaxID=1965333 RepID=UPI002AB9FF1E|nr:glycosyltransferase [Prosthecobacter sp.]MDZ4401095.1 glycosyltransferase [Prosthecobacter sp.]
MNAKTVCVVHCVEPFLNVSENWIYPQVMRVPGVLGSVLCSSTANLDAFPLDENRIILISEGRSKQGLLARLIFSLRSRLGMNRRKAERRVKSLKPDLLHAHFGMQAWEQLGMAARLGIPLVTSFYGFDAWRLPTEEPIWCGRYARLFRQGRCFLVEGPAMKERLVTLGCPPEKIIVHRLGADLSRLPYSERSFSKPLRVVMVGRFVEKKGLVDGVRACVMAMAAGMDIHLTIIGDASPDDPKGQEIKAEIQRLVADPACAGRIHLAGFCSLIETREIMARQDIMLSPSRHAESGDAEGGSPVVLTEAMAQGLLCIGTAHCDIPTVIKDQVTGYLCPEGDVPALTSALLQLGASVTRLQEITRSGRQHIEVCFNLESQMTAQAEIYRALIADKVGC